MITLPKKWRDEMGIENGDIVKAKKEAKVIIETAPQTKPVAPYRALSADEITEFLEADNVPDELTKKVEKKISPSLTYMRVFFDASVLIAALLSPTGVLPSSFA